MRKRFLTITSALIATVLLSAFACGNDSSAQQDESHRQQSNYEFIVANQPALEARYSHTRETINFWTQTWGTEPGQLAYVYLTASNGQMIGYIIFEGPPVSYCASITPPYRWEDIPNDGGNTETTVPAPAMDAAYYSGGQCSVYYGKEAVTGSYREFSIGNGINYLLSDQPLPRQDVEPIFVTSVEDVQ